MAKMYQYTLLKQDGTTEDLGVSKQKKFDGAGGLYEILRCTTILLIPTDYYNGRGYGRPTMFADEEGRFNSENHQNPHFNVLAPGWDVVGDVVMEKVYHG